MVGEERVGAFPESRGGFFAFVGEVLGVGQPGVVINGVVQERVSHAAAVAPAGLATQLAMAAPVGDAAQFLDVDMDQVAGSRVLIAAGFGPAYR
ncbi:hypothetical protein BAB78_22985 [Mycobacteroides abscessus]|nr:hypothetical protein BAB78_01245 [Mycobacteroides abscessus]ANO21082.1 hypothetical protein BAB78_22985 [Mycobacteroides abscessus]